MSKSASVIPSTDPQEPPAAGAANEGTRATRKRAESARLRAGREIRLGLGRRHKRLPSWLLYDARGSRLFEEITTLPEYPVARAEIRLLQARADEIVEAALEDSTHELAVAELGAGSMRKTRIVLDAVVRRQGDTTFMPADVSSAALAAGCDRLAREAPRLDVTPVIGRHERAVAMLDRLPGRQLVLFLGSSIGNHTSAGAVRLLSSVRHALRPGAALLLGTDMRKGLRAMLDAYDDSLGVTSAFNKNLLARINRQFGGHFDLARFRHVVAWNERASRIELYLESTVAQRVRIDALDVTVTFGRGERIHTESSVKYDDARVHALLTAAGLVRERTFFDRIDRFALHLARVWTA